MVEDDQFWQRKVASLEAEREACQAELENARKGIDPLRKELQSAQEELKKLLNAVDHHPLHEEEGPETGGSGSLEQRGGQEVRRLERELRAGKVGFEQTRFERDCLEAELHALRKALKIAGRRSKPGRIERVGGSERVSHTRQGKPARPDRTVSAVTSTTSTEPARVEAAVKVNDDFQPGACFLYEEKLKFDPDFAGREVTTIAQFNLDTASHPFLLSNKMLELEDSEIASAERAMMRLTVQKGSCAVQTATSDEDPMDNFENNLEFVGFQDAIEAIHARVLEELLHRKPSMSLKQLTGGMESNALHTLSSRRRVLSASTSGVPTKPELAAANARDNSTLSSGSPAKPNPSRTSTLSAKATTGGRGDSSHRQVNAPSAATSGTQPHHKPNDHVPSLSEESKLLTKAQMVQIFDAIPMRYRSSDLQLSYSTMRDGISLHTFYQRCAKKAPTVVLLQDSNGSVFGCYASAPWKVDKNYYGTGESFVFSVLPRFEIFRWTRANSYFQLSKEGFLAMGGGGHFALWVDSDFYHGTSNECQTFGSPCLASGMEFTCVKLEVWSIHTAARRRP